MACPASARHAVSSLFWLRRQLRFHLGHFCFQCLKTGTGAGQDEHLAVELFPTDQIQFKALLQSGFSKLDLVSREEFDSQMIVLARTRARLEALEAKMAEMEAQLAGQAKE